MNGFRSLIASTGGLSESGDIAASAAEDRESGVTYRIVVKLKTDTGGDGLLDDWEKNGRMINGRFLDLPAMGADPNHKDIFVEADFMIAGDHSHDFITSERQDVIAAYAAAPVTNSDNLPGITLHIDAGPDSVMDLKTGATWGSRSQTTAIDETTLLGTFRNGQYDWRNLFFAFNGVDSPGGVELPTQSQQYESTSREATIEELNQTLSLSPYLVGVFGSPFQYSLPGAVRTYPFRIKNEGKNADSYTVSGESSQGWATFPGLPASIELEPGQSVVFDATLRIPTDAPPKRCVFIRREGTFVPR